MSSKYQRDYLARHRRINSTLVETIKSTGHACVDVSQLAQQLGMDIRTVRAHLEIMEVDSAGVFMDSAQKLFCTKEGVALLANALKLGKNNIS